SPKKLCKEILHKVGIAPSSHVTLAVCTASRENRSEVMDTSKTANEMSSRQFLSTVGMIGGGAAVFSVMGTLGLLSPETMKAAAFAPREPTHLARSNGRGKRLATLGARIAGMTAGYKLAAAADSCTVLEARARPAPSIWSVRRGTTVA